MDQLVTAAKDEVEQAGGATVLLKYLLNPVEELSDMLRRLKNLYPYHILGIGVTRCWNKKPDRFCLVHSDKLQSDHKGWPRKWSLIGKNDIADEQKISKAENHNKAQTFQYQHTNT